MDRIKINNLVNGNGIVDNFKNNSLFFYNKYQKSDKLVTSIPIAKMEIGRFYFISYRDDSNWMKYSPIFTVDFRKFGNSIIIFGINFNFIPLEVRSAIFDPFFTEQNFTDDDSLNANYSGSYSALLEYGFEYALVEYNMAQIESVHRINMEMVPRFLYSQHPKNVYDPSKLYGIWKAKISSKNERHQEMTKSMVRDFFDSSDDIIENYEVLKKHITRVRKSFDKYGGQ